ncbi:hypothetical protein BRADI_4g34080v3 [Brachypodium distachyon]|uniref:Uncharacterized protein n=1 Tax=Brachypodium distachyon TaxID=15368 RepID=I1IRE2_BRADI|nr:hypothetical protein BRADI_4g34080v3 [Brachypodium distachyon]
MDRRSHSQSQYVMGGFRLFLSTEPRRRDAVDAGVFVTARAGVRVYVGVRVCTGFRVGLSYKLTTGWEVAVALLLYALYPLALAALVEAALFLPRYYYPRGLPLPLIGDEESALLLPPPPPPPEEAARDVVGLAPSLSLSACHLLV